MRQIPVSTLEGPLLAEFVARAQGWETDVDDVLVEYWCISATGEFIEYADRYRPDINGGQAMELVEEFGISIMPLCKSVPYSEWAASLWEKVQEYVGADGYPNEYKLHEGYGETALIAICRTVVASKFGEYVIVDNDGAAGVEE